jgi:signal peptidase II
MDALLKNYTYHHIPNMIGEFPYGGIKIFENWFHINFSLNYVENTGAAWGAFSSYSFYLILIRVLLIALLIMMFVKASTNAKKAFLVLILAGACGNVLDYFIYGHVVDMFHFTFFNHSYGIFNLADTYIFLGIIGLLFCKNPQKAKS